MLEYQYASIDELGNALRTTSVSAVELATHVVTLLNTVGRDFNAVATTLDDRAIRAATAADAVLEAGNSHRLCGIPYGVKDLFSAAGGPTTWGSPAFAGQVIESDADVVSKLEKMGAILTAKLSLSELAGGGSPKMPGASLHGAGINPWNRALYSGGSSSGSAISVSLGLLPFALGTETGGSVLWPSAFTGVTGLRTTKDAISRVGAMTLSETLDKVGIIARSAADCDTVLGVLAPAIRKPVDQVVTAELTVAYDSDEIEEAAPEMKEALAKALDEFIAMGCRVVPNRFPRRSEYIAALKTIIAAEGAFEFRHQLGATNFQMTDETQQNNLRAGLVIRLEEYLQARLETVPDAERSFARVFDEADVILSITRTEPTPSLDAPRRPRDDRKLADILAAAGNLAGVPAASMPAGLSSKGYPVGIQVIGPRASDALLLSVVREFQNRTGHHMLRPEWEIAKSGGEANH